MDASISQLQIDTKLHEALEDLDLRVGGSLMDAVVAVDVNQQWVHRDLHKKPDHLDVTVVRSPVHRCVATDFGRVRHRLEVVDFLFVVTCISVIVSLILIHVLQMRLVLD